MNMNTDSAKLTTESTCASNLEAVIKAMETVFESAPYGIDHTMNVLNNARQIIREEKINSQSAHIVELSAVLHDIGALEAMRKHGSMEGHLQELEGVPVAKEILQRQNYEQSVIDRVCYIVGNHHTPENIDGMDFRILWEADLIENMQVMDCIKDKEKLKQFISENFKTQAGKALASNKYK
jgi:response regulator RpfG family c-di-GMP phosphodiesterase